MAWRKWLRRPPAERGRLLWHAVRAGVDLTLFWCANRLDPSLRLSRRILASAIRGGGGPAHPDASSAIDIVSWCAHRHPLHPHCLEIALARAAQFERGGVVTRVVIGVRRDGDGLESHAWLDASGAAVAADPSFAPVAVLDPRERGPLPGGLSRVTFE